MSQGCTFSLHGNYRGKEGRIWKGQKRRGGICISSASVAACVEFPSLAALEKNTRSAVRRPAIKALTKPEQPQSK